MYFNEKNNDTNVDKEFEKKKNPFLDFSNTPKPLLIGVGVGGVILLVIIILLFMPKKEPELEYYLTLNGDTDIIIYEGSKYIENGYSAYDSLGNKYDTEVEVNNQIDYSKSGEYVITYKFKDIEKKRLVTVVSSQDLKTFLVLNGSNPSIVLLNGSYEDQGVTVIDSKYTSEEMKNRVKVESNVDTSKIGRYRVVYSVINDAGVTFNMERIVIVTDSTFNLLYSPVEYTNNKVTITGKVLDSRFDYILLPDGSKTTDKDFNYDVFENDTYLFKIYDANGNYIEKTIDINNIDKEKPNGYCMAIVSDKTQVNVTASDDTEVIGYKYNIDNDSSEYLKSETFTSNKKADWVNVDIKDAAGNESKIYCDSKVYTSDIPYVPTEPSSPSGSSPFVSSLKVKAKDMAKYVSNYSKLQIVTFTNGRLVDSYSSGCSDTTSMYISSGTKTILGIVAAKMQEDSIIKLDGKIEDYWHRAHNYNLSSCSSEWRSMLGNEDTFKRYTDPSKKLIQSGATIRHALTNSSAIYNLNMIHMIPGDNSSEYFGGGLSKNYGRAGFMLAHISGQLFKAKVSPGVSTEYNYKSDGLTRESTLAGTTMQVAMKESLNEYMRKTIFNKINAQSNPNFKSGNTIYLGTLYSSSASDYAKIIAAVAADGVYNGNRIFSTSTVNEIEKVYSNLKNQTIAFDYINGKYTKFGYFNVSYFGEYGIEYLKKYESYVSYDPKTSSGFVAIVNFNSDNSNLSSFNSMENYFYSTK